MIPNKLSCAFFFRHVFVHAFNILQHKSEIGKIIDFPRTYLTLGMPVIPSSLSVEAFLALGRSGESIVEFDAFNFHPLAFLAWERYRNTKNARYFRH